MKNLLERAIEVIRGHNLNNDVKLKKVGNVLIEENALKAEDKDWNGSSVTVFKTETSSNVLFAGFDYQKKELYLAFHKKNSNEVNTRYYVYKNVSYEVYEGLLFSSSRGSYVNKYIKGKVNYEVKFLLPFS